MTQQEKQEIDKRCDEFCEYRRTHSSGYPPREWFMAGVKALDELRKLSEPEPNVGEAVEELSKRIKAILDTTFTNSADFSRVSTEIAVLMQPDNELLEALKRIQKCTYDASSSYRDICDIAIEAISNYEKQTYDNTKKAQH